MASSSRNIFITILSFVLFDWATKFAVLLGYKSCASHPKLYTHNWGGLSFSIFPTFNEGAAFGLFTNYKKFLLIFRLCVIVGILAYLFFKRKSLPSLTRFALILLCSGAIGNVGDIFFYGHVIDFLAFSYRSFAFPTFNFSDVFISLGTLLLVYKLYFPKKQKTNSI